MKAQLLPKGGLLLCFDTFQLCVDICSTEGVNKIDWEGVDCVLVSHPLGMSGLPEITEYCGGVGVKIYSSEPVLDAGCILLESTWEEHQYDICEIRSSLEKVTTTSNSETITINDTTSITPLTSPACIGGFGWLIRNYDDFILVQNAGPVDPNELHKQLKGRPLTSLICSSELQSSAMTLSDTVKKIKFHSGRNETVLLCPSLLCGPMQSLVWCQSLMENRTAVSIIYNGGKLLEYASRLYNWLPPELKQNVKVPDCPLKGYSGAPFVVTSTSQIEGKASGRCCYIPATGSEAIITELVKAIENRIHSKAINTSAVVVIKDVECGLLSLNDVNQQIEMFNPRIVLCCGKTEHLQKFIDSNKKDKIKSLSGSWESIPRVSATFQVVGGMHRGIAKRSRNHRSSAVPGLVTWSLGEGNVRRRGSSFLVTSLSPSIDSSFFGNISKESFSGVATEVAATQSGWQASLPDMNTVITSKSPTETSVQFSGSTSQLKDVQRLLEQSLLRS